MIDEIENVLINGNLRYQWKILQGLENIKVKDQFPKYPILILTCIDPRIDVHRIFQLNPGDVFILRNAGNLYTQDTLRSILLTVYQYNIKYIIVLGHLDCAMKKIKLLELKQKIPYEFLSNKLVVNSDLFSTVREFLKPFVDELKNIKQQVKSLERIHLHNPEVKITGMLYDVNTGWVFECDMLNEFDVLESFKKHYRALIREKKYQFIDFIETIEDEIINNNELEEVMLEEDDYEEEKGDLKKLVKIEEEFTTPIIMPRIQIPKIYFQGVKIYIPKRSRK